MSALVILRSVTGPMAAQATEAKPRYANESEMLERMLKRVERTAKSNCEGNVELESLSYSLYNRTSLSEYCLVRVDLAIVHSFINRGPSQEALWEP